jgi:surface polysaccharide O-acyltransferase-like enzyme
MTTEAIKGDPLNGSIPNSKADAKAKPRLIYIDNLRTVLITGVILYHAAIVYGAPGIFPYREGREDEITTLVFVLFLAIFAAFGLGLFYMIAGYFTPGSCDRKGTGSFLVDRLIRLGIPLLIYILIIDPFIIYTMRLNLTGARGSFFEYLPKHFAMYDSLGVGPMWFVLVLLIFTLLYVVWRYVTKLLPDMKLREGEAPGDLTIALFALALGVFTFIWRIWLPEGSYFRLLNFPTSSLPQYFSLFVAGIIAYRRNWLASLSDDRFRLWFWIATVLIFVMFLPLLVLGGALEGNTDPFLGGFHWQSLARSIWEQFLCMAVVIIFPIWFRRRFNRQGRVAKAMSSSAYAVYFIHAPVLVIMALLFRAVSLHPLIKFALIGPLSVGLCFMIGYYLRKLPFVRRVL